ncbi:hypothetical protein, partial [Vibrio aestuarianus]|nr:hypothetical protein [Vibrio aestuarianus]
AQSQAAQPGASGGWIRDKNGWRELKKTPRVFATQGSTSARDAMWRRSSVEENGSSPSTDNPPQIPEKYKVSGTPPWVASKDHWTVNTPNTVLTTEGGTNNTRGIFDNVSDIEKLLKKQKKRANADIVTTEKGKADIIPRGEGKILAKPFDPSNLPTES